MIGIIFLRGNARLTYPGGVLHSLLHYAFSFLDVPVTASAAERLAPSFGGRLHRFAALEKSAYSSTPVWLAGFLAEIPGCVSCGSWTI